MTIDIALMRAKVRKATGIPADDPDLTDAEIDDYLNRSFWEITDKFHYREKECIGTFNLVIGISSYNLTPPYEAFRSWSITDMNNNNAHVQLKNLINAEEYDKLYNEDVNQRAIPEFYLREACLIRFWPVPDKTYEIVYRKWKTLQDLSGTNTTTSIPRAWHELIIYGADYRALIDLGDISRANAFKQIQVAGIDTLVPTEQKEIVNTQYAGLEVIGREY